MGWLPDHIWLAQKLLKGGRLGGVRKGKGKGKGKRRGGGIKEPNKEKVVWIGGFKEMETKDRELEGKLKEFINKKADGCVFAQVGRKGSGGAVFSSEEEASSAISILNGAKFQGRKLEFDVWTKEEK